ncbi:MAG: NADH-ubiquinone oxidoreductase-F iron-sulfur binding region domain-containing protein [Acidobacteriota bacterium]|nr:NADH-ubiquinone oxidoreductase-F iron-sulfur binding region domain-containing protein [Acidobacteriota bacterium]
MTIVNFMPAYAQAPVSLRLLGEHLDDAVAKAEAEDVRLLLPQDSRLVERFGDKAAPMDGSIGFLYNNNTAVEGALKGQGLVSTGIVDSGAIPLVSGESWLLGTDSKTLWLEGAEMPIRLPTRTTARAILQAAGVTTDDLKALYLGFPQNMLITADKLDRPLFIRTDYARVYTVDNCMARALQEIASHFHREACGHCVYGYEGGFQIESILTDIVNKRGAAGDLALLRDLCPMMSGRALCNLDRALAHVVTEILDHFGDEIEAHISKRQCPAGECRAFMTYHILVSRCTGCGACMDACDDGAIMGKAKFVHVIDQRACSQCNRCLEACPEGAVVMAGIKKPKTPPRPIPVRR